MMSKKEIERELRLLAQEIRHEMHTPTIQEHMLDRVRNILQWLEEIKIQ